MNRFFEKKSLHYCLAVIFFFLFYFPLNAQQISVKVHLRGVFESKISLLPLAGSNALKVLVEKSGVKSGETATILIPVDKLPGEFVMRFDYKEKESSTPYPSEKHIIIYNQNLELWVNPPYCNNGDSTYFQKDEKENTLYAQFTKENGKQKEKLSLLQNFLMSYDSTSSMFYQQGIYEYKKRCNAYNKWIKEQSVQNQTFFISHSFRFQYVPQIEFQGSEADRAKNVITHYFDGIDFNDTLLMRTSTLKEWMDGYVNLYGAMATSIALRDSLFSAAGKAAVEKAKLGHPLVYGWMVDYFFKGYESTGIDAGMKVLEPYVNDPNCMTSKRLEILKRLNAIKTLVAGTKAPDIVLKDAAGNDFELSKMDAEGKNILLLFWSASCSHCAETVAKLYPLSQQADVKQKLKIIAISMDETTTEVNDWNKKIIELKDWKHMRAEKGVNSIVANDYAILSTPVMFLLDGKTKTIKATPNDVEQLKKELEK